MYPRGGFPRPVLPGLRAAESPTRRAARRDETHPSHPVVGSGLALRAPRNDTANHAPPVPLTAASYSARARLTSARSETSATATSHQAPPAAVERRGSVSITTTLVRSAARARRSAASSSARLAAFSAAAPRLPA